MKLVNFRCNKCGKDKEELMTSEEQKSLTPTTQLLRICSCGGQYEIWTFKNNCHRARVND